MLGWAVQFTIPACAGSLPSLPHDNGIRYGRFVVAGDITKEPKYDEEMLFWSEMGSKDAFRTPTALNQNGITPVC